MAGSLNKDVCFHLASCVKQGIVLENELPPYVGKKKKTIGGRACDFLADAFCCVLSSYSYCGQLWGKEGMKWTWLLMLLDVMKRFAAHFDELKSLWPSVCLHCPESVTGYMRHETKMNVRQRTTRIYRWPSDGLPIVHNVQMLLTEINWIREQRENERKWSVFYI